jgi:hypothetical protein
LGSPSKVVAPTSLRQKWAAVPSGVSGRDGAEADPKVEPWSPAPLTAAGDPSFLEFFGQRTWINV